MKNETDIDILIGKYLAGEAGPEEAMELEDWKNRSEANRLYFEQCARVFGLNSQNLVEVNAHTAWKKMNLAAAGTEAKTVQLRQRTVWRVAAAVAVLLVMSTVIVFIMQTGKTGSIVYASGNTVKKVELNDKSEIEILPHSSLELSQGFGVSNRTVKLKGSGKFTVEHDENLPFIIDAGNVYIKDIGTIFTVTEANDTLTVYVEEGSVALYNDSVTAYINAFSTAYYIRSTGEIRHHNPIEPGLPVNTTFKHASLRQLVNFIQDVYKVKVSFEVPETAECIINTSFNTSQDVETILSIATETMDLTYERTVDGYLVKGRCSK